MKTQPKVFLHLSRAHSALFRAADRRSKTDIGLSTSQQAVLFTLARQDGMSQREIGALLSLGKSGLSGMVDRLVAKGLIRKEATEEDARVTRVFLEPSGLELVRRSQSVVKRFNDALLAPFDEAEQDVIARFLHHITENAEQIINPEAAKNTSGKGPVE
ncbi:MarR family winged helix-turn-helix transcriptional regulator [Shimia thalassica]|uniref:MarR family winged helix-turn-helix transcriptional regulator n=1 Tax=Shimia thalassica TaxID=1715693 RepID=UPI0026E1283C|nr:MarR family winged helix-turn-helix transcriptional regulator [Shimia thalassica]MDO6797388.1 MarR family winged helix-turn-helix transcriptional regulator [Shimia thalassica]